VTSQDMCVMCGALGTNEEGCLISCCQCGQCYHPYCVNVKVCNILMPRSLQNTMAITQLANAVAGGRYMLTTVEKANDVPDAKTYKKISTRRTSYRNTSLIPLEPPVLTDVSHNFGATWVPLAKVRSYFSIELSEDLIRSDAIIKPLLVTGDQSDFEQRMALS